MPTSRDHSIRKKLSAAAVVVALAAIGAPTISAAPAFAFDPAKVFKEDKPSAKKLFGV